MVTCPFKANKNLQAFRRKHKRKTQERTGAKMYFFNPAPSTPTENLLLKWLHAAMLLAIT